MAKEFLLTAKFFYSTVASVKEKALAVFVVLCIFANALVPKFAIDSKDYSTLCQIMKSQSVLFEFFSFSSIPVKIVNELFNEQRGVMQPLAQKKAPKNDTSNTSNTASDFSISATNIRDASVKFLSQRVHDLEGNVASVFSKYFSAPPDTRSSGAPPGVYLGFIALLMFYFMRARSALPDAAVINSLSIYRTQFKNLNWVFSLSIIIPQGSFV